MNLKCAHCGARLTVHRNLALHPSDEGCRGVERPGGVAAPPPDEKVKSGLRLANAAVSYCNGSPPDELYQIARAWNRAQWETVLMLYKGERGRVISDRQIKEALDLLKLRCT